MFGVPLHKLLIHFPIALTIMAAVFDSWAVYAKKTDLHKTGYRLMLWASAFALSAVVTGLQLAGVTRIDPGTVTGHAGAGMVSAVIITTTAILRYSADAREQQEFKTGWLALEIAAAVLVTATAVLGHRL